MDSLTAEQIATLIGAFCTGSILGGGFLVGLALRIFPWQKNAKRATGEQPKAQTTTDITDTMQGRDLDATKNALVIVSNTLGRVQDQLEASQAQLAKSDAQLAKSNTQLAESVATRDLQTGQIASLRIDVDNLKKEAQEREAAHAVALAASQEKIAEQTQTIEAQSKTIARQDATIQALREYVGQLGPLLRKAGIKTDELPQLPPIAANGDTQASGEHRKIEGE